MFCKNCGKEIPEGIKFCAECGTPISTEEISLPDDGATMVYTEEPVAAPAEQQTAVAVADAPVAVAEYDNSQSENVLGQKKRGGAVAVIALGAVAVIALVLAAIMLLPNLFGAKPVYLYTSDDNELFFLKNLSGKADGVEVTDEEVYEIQISPDGKYVYYFEYNDRKGVTELYRVKVSDIGKEKAEAEKIASNVRTSLTLLESGEVIYRKNDDGEIRVFDGKDDYKLSGESSSCYVHEESRTVFFETTENDGTRTLYRIDIKDGSKKEKIVDDYRTILGSYDTYAKDGVLVYVEDSEEYDEYGNFVMDVCALKNGKKETLAKDLPDYPIFKEISKSNISFYYVTSEGEEFTLYDFVTDRMAAEDAKWTQEPSYRDYQKSNGWYGTTTDWDAYYEAHDKWYAARNRNYLRDELKGYTYTMDKYTLVLYENGKETTVAENMSSRYPEYDSVIGLFFYSKNEGEVEPVADVADLDYSYQIWELLERGSYDEDEIVYMNLNGKETEFEDAEDFDIYNVLRVSDKEVLLFVDEGDNTFYSYKIQGSELKRGEKISDDVYCYDYDYVDGKLELYIYEDADEIDGTGTLICYSGGKTTTVAEDASRVDITEDGRTFMLNDGTYDSHSGYTLYTLYAVQNGKEKEIAEDVMGRTLYLEGGKAMFVSDEDLYYWNGKECVLLAKDVVNFWTNESISYRAYTMN